MKMYTVKNSDIEGKGVFAICDIPAKIRIIQYLGKKIAYPESLEAENTTYHYQLDMDTVIVGENDAKYINHSCNPNCYTKVIDQSVWIISERDIDEGEELTFNYGYDFEDALKNKCFCGTKNCVGFIANSSVHEKLKEYRKK